MDDGDKFTPPTGRPRARSLVGTLLLRSRETRSQSVSKPSTPVQVQQQPPSGWELLSVERTELKDTLVRLTTAGVAEASKYAKALSAIETLGGTDPAKALKMFKALQGNVSVIRPGNDSPEAVFPQTKEMSDLVEDSRREVRSEARNRYVPRWEALLPQKQALEKAIADKAFGDPPDPAKAQAIQQFEAAIRGAGAATISKGDYETGLRHLDAMEAAMRVLGPAPGPSPQALNDTDLADAETRRPAVEQRIQAMKDAVAAGRYAGVDPQALNTFAAATKQAGDDLTGCSLAVDGAGMIQALDALEAAAKALARAAASRVLDLAKGGKKPGDARKAATSLLANEPDLLRELAAQPGGADLLDKMVKNLGSSAGSPEDKRFMAEAIKARFNMDELSGDLTTKALPRLYEVLLIAPASHTIDNPMFKSIKRNKGSPEASFYTTGTGNIVLNLEKTGFRETKMSCSPDDSVPKDIRPKDKEVSYFNHTALHELGHAVDDKLSFMKSKAGQANYGGWKTHGVPEIADIAGNSKNFYTDHAAYPKVFLQAYLTDILKKGDPKAPGNDVTGLLGTGGRAPTLAELKADPGIAQAMTDYAVFERDGWGDPNAATSAQNDANKLVGYRTAPERKAVRMIIENILAHRMPPDQALQACALVGAAPDWKVLASHPAAVWCAAVRMSSKTAGLWEQGAGAAASLAIGGRVYQQSYDTEWNSYELGARSKGVTQYQFRAPAEWFSELYAAILMKLIPDKHPDAKLLSWIS